MIKKLNNILWFDHVFFDNWKRGRTEGTCGGRDVWN